MGAAPTAPVTAPTGLVSRAAVGGRSGMHGWNLVMHGRLHNFDDDEKGIVDKLAMSTQSCILDQKQLSVY